MTPVEEQNVLNAIHEAIAALHTGLPARVTATKVIGEGDAATCESITVQPLLKVAVYGPDMKEQIDDLPEVERVPYLGLRFGGWMIHMAPKVGDLVYLTFAERSLDRWMGSTDGQACDPTLAHKLALTDAIAVSKFDPWALRPATFHPDNLIIGREDGTCFVSITPAGVLTAKCAEFKIGEAATRGIARAQDEIMVDIETAPALIGWLQAVGAIPTVSVPWPPPGVTETSFKGKITSASAKGKSE